MTTHQMTKELVIEMALMFLPKDRDDWREKCREAHDILNKSLLLNDAAWVPAKVAQYAFESCGYAYFELEHGEWRRRLDRIAFKHWTISRDRGEVTEP